MDRKPFAVIRIVLVHHFLWAVPNSILFFSSCATARPINIERLLISGQIHICGRTTQRIMWQWSLTRWGYIIIITIYVMRWLCTENVVTNILIVSFIRISRSFSMAMCAMRLVHVKCSGSGHEFLDVYVVFMLIVLRSHTYGGESWIGFWRYIILLCRKSGEQSGDYASSWAHSNAKYIFANCAINSFARKYAKRALTLLPPQSRSQTFHTMR